MRDRIPKGPPLKRPPLEGPRLRSAAAPILGGMALMAAYGFFSPTWPAAVVLGHADAVLEGAGAAPGPRWLCLL